MTLDAWTLPTPGAVYMTADACEFVRQLFKNRQRCWFSRLRRRVVFADSDKDRVGAVTMQHLGNKWATIDAVESVMREIEAPLWVEYEGTQV